MKKLVYFIILIALLFSVSAADAIPVYVGSFEPDQGPVWTTNPPVYSGREAAALIFGGNPIDYLISIDPSSDPASITSTAWYVGWGEHDGMIFDQDYSLDVGNPGYADPGGIITARSAYVGDGAPDFAINYVWTTDALAAVPEPVTMLLLVSGLAGLGILRKKFKH